MNSYMSSGGSCCKSLAELPENKDTAIPLRVLFMETIQKKSPIKAPKVGRMKAKLK